MFDLSSCMAIVTLLSSSQGKLKSPGMHCVCGGQWKTGRARCGHCVCRCKHIYMHIQKKHTDKHTHTLTHTHTQRTGLLLEHGDGRDAVGLPVRHDTATRGGGGGQRGRLRVGTERPGAPPYYPYKYKSLRCAEKVTVRVLK
jgi:hypothetical protein